MLLSLVIDDEPVAREPQSNAHYDAMMHYGTGAKLIIFCLHILFVSKRLFEALHLHLHLHKMLMFVLVKDEQLRTEPILHIRIG